MVKRRGSFPFWDTGLPFQVLLLLFSGRVLSTKRSIISHPFLAPAWVDDFPKLPVWWDMDVSKNNGTPKSSILIGFSIIFTIHFGGFPPIFGSTPICFCWQGSTSPWRIESPSPEMLQETDLLNSGEFLNLRQQCFLEKQKFQLDTACECLWWSYLELKTSS